MNTNDRKMFTTYVMGLFKNFDRKCHDTPALVPDIIDENDARCDVVKMFPRYEINQKVSKRWSGPFHTIYSKSDIKRIVTSPKGYLMSYFDISAAEVRSLAFFSKDPKLCEMFLTGQDPYVWTAKNALNLGSASHS